MQNRFFLLFLIFIVVLLAIDSPVYCSNSRIKPLFGLGLGGNINYGSRCHLSPEGNIFVFGGIKTSAFGLKGVDNNIIVGITNSSFQYSLNHLSYSRAKTFGVNRLITLDLSFLNTIKISQKSEIGYGIGISTILISRFLASYGLNTTNYSAYSINTDKGMIDTKNELRNLFPYINLYYSVKAFHLFNNHVIFFVQTRINVLSTYKHSVEIEYISYFNKYISPVNPKIIQLCFGLSY